MTVVVAVSLGIVFAFAKDVEAINLCLNCVNITAALPARVYNVRRLVRACVVPLCILLSVPRIEIVRVELHTCHDPVGIHVIIFNAAIINEYLIAA